MTNLIKKSSPWQSLLFLTIDLHYAQPKTSATKGGGMAEEFSQMTDEELETEFDRAQQRMAPVRQ